MFGARGFRVEWIEYPGGIQIVEAFQGNDLALGGVGEGPPVFAHAASVAGVSCSGSMETETNDTSRPRRSPRADWRWMSVWATVGQAS